MLLDGQLAFIQEIIKTNQAKKLRALGNSVIVVEHDEKLLYY